MIYVCVVCRPGSSYSVEKMPSNPVDKTAVTSVEHPIFVIGVHGSGTTLLRYMLNSNPRIYIPPESDFIPRFFLQSPNGVLSEKRIGNMLHVIFRRYRFVKEWRGDPPRRETFALQMPIRTPAAFLDLLYSTYASQHGAVRWGDKTPIYTSYVDLLHQLFPSARFVHIIRDGRDVALSMLDKWGAKEHHVDLYYAGRIWAKRIRKARACGARLGTELYYELRYESLVERPEQELRALSEFLGEPYVSQMAQSHILGQERIPLGDFHEAVRQPPGKSRVGRWRREMSERDQRLFQHASGGLLNELGYTVMDLGKLSLKEWARLMAFRVKYEVLQAGRRILEKVRVMPPI